MRKRDRETHNLPRPAEDSRGYILVARRGILRSTSAHVAATTRRLRRQRTMLLTSERRRWAEREKERARDRERENQTSLAESLSRVSWSSHLRSGESARFRCARKIKRERERNAGVDGESVVEGRDSVLFSRRYYPPVALHHPSSAGRERS